MRQTLKLGRMTLVSLACGALLAGCGGGGGDNAGGRLQVINFDYPGGGALLSAPTTLRATATSGLPVTFASGTPATCTVAGDQLTLVAAGECLVIANQSGGTSSDGVVWARADQASHLFNILKAPHVPVVPAGAVMMSAGETVTLSAVTSGGLPASYTSDTESVCTVSGTTLTLRSVGLCGLSVESAGDGTYAPLETRAFVTVDVRPPYVVQRGESDPTVVLASIDASGRAMTYATSTPSVCSLSSRELTLTAGGVCHVSASVEGVEVESYSVSVDPRVLLSGFDSARSLTTENGALGIGAGSAIDGGWCGGRDPSNCSTFMAGAFAIGDYTIRPVQNDPNWNADSTIAWAYFGFTIDAPRTPVLNPDGSISGYDLQPFMVPTETTLFLTYGIDPTMYESGSRIFVRLVTGHGVPRSDGSTCYVAVSQLPDMPSADPTPRLLNLADFAVTENCGLDMPKSEGWMFNWGITAESKAAALNELRTHGIRQVEFSPTSVNTTMPRPNADGSIPAKTDPAYILPNSVFVIAPFTVQ